MFQNVNLEHELIAGLKQERLFLEDEIRQLGEVSGSLTPQVNIEMLKKQILKAFTQFEKDFLVYINSNHDNFTEKDVKRLLRTFSNKVINLLIEYIGDQAIIEGENSISSTKFK
jgi:hypothetical protein